MLFHYNVFLVDVSSVEIRDTNISGTSNLSIPLPEAEPGPSSSIPVDDSEKTGLTLDAETAAMLDAMRNRITSQTVAPEPTAEVEAQETSEKQRKFDIKKKKTYVILNPNHFRYSKYD